MVKAKKRKDGRDHSFKKREKEIPFGEKYGRYIILLILALITIGFTLSAPIMTGSGGGGEPPQDETDQPDYGIAEEEGLMSADSIGEISASAIFGQLTNPLRSKEALDADLYLFNDSPGILILTDKKESEIDATVDGDYITYGIADCGNFDCLLEGEYNETTMFRVYSLSTGSEFLSTQRIGFIERELAL